VVTCLYLVSSAKSLITVLYGNRLLSRVKMARGDSDADYKISFRCGVGNRYSDFTTQRFEHLAPLSFPNGFLLIVQVQVVS
jgi:hypothetical protein